jgi:MFS transporter, AAHS family, 3-hydroxyphenylpropionic acid transporter
MNEPTATHWSHVLILWLCGILAAMQFAKISFAFVALQQVYGATPAAMGLVLSTVGLVGLVFGVTMGVFAPAIGYQRLLLGGLCLGALVSLAQSLMLPLPLLWASRVAEGASHLAVVVAAPTLIVASCAPQHRSVAMGLWSTFVGLAFAITSAGGGWLVNKAGLAGLFQWHAAGMAAMVVLTWVVLRPTNAMTNGQATTQARAPWPVWGDLPKRHADTYLQWTTALPGLCFFCYTAMAVALLTFLPQLADGTKPWLPVALPLLSIVGNFSAGWLAQHWVNPIELVRAAFLGLLLGGAALGLSLEVGAGAAVAAMALMFLTGLAGGAAFSLIPHLTQEVPLQARANGAVAQLGNLGSTAGPPLFAVLISHIGAWGVVVPVVFLALLGFGIATWGGASLRRSVTIGK